MRSRRALRVAVLASALLAAGIAGTGVAGAAGGYSVGAPYTDGTQSGLSSCPWPDVSPHCATSADAEPANGTMRAGVYTDSGAHGALPGAGQSSSLSEMDQAIDLHGRSHAVVLLDVHVAKVATSSTGDGRTYVYVSAGCDSCADDTPYQFIDGPQDVRLRLDVDRGGMADPVVVHAVLQAITYVDCDQVFCLAPRGTARAAATAKLVRIEVTPR